MNSRIVLYITGVSGSGLLVEKAILDGYSTIIVPSVKVPIGTDPQLFACSFVESKLNLPCNGFTFKIIDEKIDKIIDPLTGKEEVCRVFRYNIGITPGSTPNTSWKDEDGFVHHYVWSSHELDL